MSRGPLLYCLLVSFIAFLVRRWYQDRRRNPKSLPLHPGPKPIPLLGNVSDLPKSHAWLKVAEWKKEHGDIVRIQAFGANVLFLNSWEAANDLLNKRSTVYSDRPDQIMYTQVTGWAWALFALHYGNEWRQQRKLFHQYFHSDASMQFRPSQMIELKSLLIRLLDSPQSFMDHIFHMGVSTMMRVTYGIEVSGSDNTYDNIIKDVGHNMAITGVPGTFMVDYVPLLKHVPEWFPGATFKKLGKIWTGEVQRYRCYPFTTAKQSLEKGNNLPSALSLMLQTLNGAKDEKLSEDTIRDVAAAAFGAGSETTAFTIQNFFLAMALNPDIQSKAQAEVDTVVGTDRLPDFDDLPSLPYVEAVMMEVLRFHPVIPLTTPHMNMQDDEYNGYFIPKGTTIIANAWAMLRDEKVYPNPSLFSPERFLDGQGRIDPRVQHPDNIAFGFGRRICPGRHMAMNTLMITLASVLSVFNIGHAVDDKGERIPVYGEVTSGLLTHPLPFKCNIKPRRTENIELVRRSLELSQ